jgi:hypothetical protein
MPLPNRRMIALFDAMYGSRLASVAEPLWARLGDFLAGKLQIDQDDYLDELEPIED